ncbi:MAG: hypothetical protein L3J44_00450 [Campylobacteraceae bacterium]|nr:hypothetical protein [Campylobacteraceae bacterium]
MRYIVNFRVFSILYVIIIFVAIKYNLLTIQIINEYLGTTFFSKKLINISLANVGIFASLTGFLIASIPFLVTIIIKENYLINAVKNNLNDITIALKIILILFIVSLYVLFSNLDDYNDNLKIIILSLFVYLYIVLIYYIYEIIQILHIFVSDLKNLKQNMTDDNSTKIINLLTSIEENTKLQKGKNEL